jgi:hypothetical protein
MRCALPLLTLVALCTACGGPGSLRPAKHVGADATARPALEAAMRGWYARFLSQFRTSSLTLRDREVFAGEGWAVVKGSTPA